MASASFRTVKSATDLKSFDQSDIYSAVLIDASSKSLDSMLGQKNVNSVKAADTVRAGDSPASNKSFLMMHIEMSKPTFNRSSSVSVKGFQEVQSHVCMSS